MREEGRAVVLYVFLPVGRYNTPSKIDTILGNRAREDETGVTTGENAEHYTANAVAFRKSDRANHLYTIGIAQLRFGLIHPLEKKAARTYPKMRTTSIRSAILQVTPES